MEREARRIKQSLVNLWYKKLRDRIQAFWLKLKNENLSKTYEEWRNSTPIILPREVQMYHRKSEPEDQRRLRECKVLDKFKMKKDRLELTAQDQEEKYKRIDEEIISIFSDKTKNRKRELLIGLWYKNTKKEEAVSQNRWEITDQIWLKNYADDFKSRYTDKNPFIRDIQHTQRNNRNYTPVGQRMTSSTQYRSNNQGTPLYTQVASNTRQNHHDRAHNTERNMGQIFNRQNEREYQQTVNHRPQYNYANRRREREEERNRIEIQHIEEYQQAIERFHNTGRTSTYMGQRFNRQNEWEYQ